jgi:serine acetyltransferase
MMFLLNRRSVIALMGWRSAWLVGWHFTHILQAFNVMNGDWRDWRAWVNRVLYTRYREGYHVTIMKNTKKYPVCMIHHLTIYLLKDARSIKHHLYLTPASVICDLPSITK